MFSTRRTREQKQTFNLVASEEKASVAILCLKVEKIACPSIAEAIIRGSGHA